MAAALQLVEKGKTPTLLDAAKANELLRAVNSLRGLQVRPDGIGQAAVTDANTILDFSALATRLDALERATAFTLAQTEALVDLAAQAETLLGLPAALTAQNTAIQGQLAAQNTAIQGQLASGTLSITCNPDGTITGTVTFSAPSP